MKRKSPASIFKKKSPTLEELRFDIALQESLAIVRLEAAKDLPDGPDKDELMMSAAVALAKAESLSSQLPTLH